MLCSQHSALQVGMDGAACAGAGAVRMACTVHLPNLWVERCKLIKAAVRVGASCIGLVPYMYRRHRDTVHVSMNIILLECSIVGHPIQCPRVTNIYI